jgi:hypothetical protein
MKRITNLGINYLDIMVVVSLVGAAIGISAPIIHQSTSKTSLQQATKMISSSIVLSRQKALAGDTKYRIRYEEQAFEIFREEEEGTWEFDQPANRFELPDDVLISSSGMPAAIVIDSAGEISAGPSPLLLRLQDQQGNRLSIRISRAGHIQEFPDW